MSLRLLVFSRRWGRRDAYSVKRTETGWVVEHMSIGGECNKTGEPYLFKNLDHDSINYPADLGEYMEWLWDQVEEQNMSDEGMQEALDVLGDWISIVEENSPGGVWKPFK